MTDVDVRDYFAAKALEGLLTGRTIPRSLPDTRHVREITLQELAADAYAIADAMLAERANPPDNIRSLNPKQGKPEQQAPLGGLGLIGPDARKNDRDRG
jgi:hypothetical protein